MSKDFYAVLDLRHTRAAQITPEDIKSAYRRALLQNHPDKGGSHQTRESSYYSIDLITEAYKTLSDPVLRAKYDLSHKGKDSSAVGSRDTEVFQTGLDVVDLDDLAYDEAAGVWFRSCRCGQERGFVVNEAELEKNAAYGELLTGCHGCSLWLKVVYEATEAEEEAPP